MLPRPRRAPGCFLLGQATRPTKPVQQKGFLAGRQNRSATARTAGQTVELRRI